MTRLYQTLFVLLIPAALVRAQTLPTLYRINPLVIDLCSPSADYRASVAFVNSRVNVSDVVSFEYNALGLEYPFIRENGKRFGGIGLSVVDRDYGKTDFVKATEVGMSMNYNLRLASAQHLTFALQPVYHFKQASLLGISTGNQWVAEQFRYDHTRPTGEQLQDNSLSYLALNTGMSWRLFNTHNDKERASLSVAVRSLNRPVRSFTTVNDREPISFLVTGSCVAVESGRFRFTPQAMLMNDPLGTVLNLMSSSEILFEDNNPYNLLSSGSVEITTRYQLRRDVGLGIMIHQPSLSFGFSYSLPLTVADGYYQQAFEFGLSLSTTLWRSPVKKVKVSTVSVPAGRDFDFENNTTRETVSNTAKSEAQVLEDKIEEFSKVRQVHFELEKNFNFGFARAELDEQARLYLDELYHFMIKNPAYAIEIIGHTDQVGKPHLNYKLSTQRARAVEDYLKLKGLPAERVKSRGVGDTDPVAPNDSDSNRMKNRRVQFIITTGK